ncbi:MAG: endopeptidase La [Synergistaceae bacterium]|jgi:ATP-dependent Lon protease|nr:endopeptidase La [Synergistaceae bacterium]
MRRISPRRKLPVVPLRDTVLFPGLVLPLFIGRPRSISAVESASARGKRVVLVAQKNSREEDPSEEDLYELGTLASVLQSATLPDGTVKVLLEGLSRVQIEAFDVSDEKIEAWVLPVPSQNEDVEDLPLRRALQHQFETVASYSGKISEEITGSLHEIESLSMLADVIASHAELKVEEKQRILETADPVAKSETLLKFLIRETEILQLESEIQERVRQEIDRTHREYYLKEQMKVIQTELDSRQGLNEVEELAGRIRKAGMPAEVEEKALQELSRFSKMPPVSAEATVARSYIEWLIELPWSKTSRDRLELGLAKTVLDKDHHGLDEVKERILEFLAVRKLASKDARSQVLCFVGPPGVGKTSLGRSIARAMDRKFVQMSLGGIRDEAEIRGHRRTYVGALPGRILQKIRQAGTCNPVLLLDEIDKLGTDFRGDPSAALLEVLDPEQNSAFTDHFLEVPFNLGQTLFITTANVTHTIPAPLLDRMEIIRLPGYVTEEKVQIAERHLWPKVLKSSGLDRQPVTIESETLRIIVERYTSESGVRELERHLFRIARKLARRILERGGPRSGKGKQTPIRIAPGDLTEYLGAPRKSHPSLPEHDEVGAAVGLAWTESGGEALVVESVTMKGKGGLILTGNLGEIMQESATAAMGYLRSTAGKWGLDEVDWQSLDTHVHVPEGAIPKDGPSAGITIATALLSCLSRRPIRHDTAMTGEITLRGKVLPVGGIKEKVLAAKRHEIRSLILPVGNRPDWEELPEWVRDEMSVTFVSSADEVFGLALRGVTS